MNEEATAPAPSPAPPSPEAGARPRPGRAVLLLRGLVVVSFVSVCTAGVLRIQDRVRGLEDFQVDLSRARVEGPSWLPAKEAAALREKAAAGGKVPLRREGLPEFVAGRVESDPHVVRVLGARRLHPDRVEVVVELRRPVALVEAGPRVAAVDAHGVRVPGDYAARTLPRIRGGDGSLPDPGAPFGKSVLEGAAVAAALPADLASSLGLAIIDVAGVAKGEGVVLRRKTAKGGTPLAVEWGRSPASESADLDPPAASKVDRLRLAAHRFPGLQGLRTVRLGFDDLVVVPL